VLQGDKGYLYIPYRYMTDRNLTADVFVIKKFSNIELGDDHWKQNVSELDFAEPIAFGAGTNGSGDNDEWSFEGGDGED
jgi:C1A family cysteine protease